jgi:hypothetical protein
VTAVPDVSGGLFGTPDSEQNRWIRSRVAAHGQVIRRTFDMGAPNQPDSTPASTGPGSADQGARSGPPPVLDFNRLLRAEYETVRRTPSWTSFTSTG